jgi:hypothetical protein
MGDCGLLSTVVPVDNDRKPDAPDTTATPTAATP